MNNYTPTMLQEWLGDTILRVHAGSDHPDVSGGIRLLEGGSESLSPGFLYLGDCAVVSCLVLEKRLPKEPVCILSAGPCPDLEDVHLPPLLWLMETDTALLKLYNRVQEQTQKFLTWDSQLRDTVRADGGLQMLLEQAKSMLDATLILVNAGYKCLAASYAPEMQDPLVEEIRQNGYFSYETVQAMRQYGAMHRDFRQKPVEYISPESGNHVILSRILLQNEVHAGLILIHSGKASGSCYLDLSALLADHVREYLLLHQDVSHGDTAAFRDLVADLIEFRITDADEAEQRRRSVELSVQRYFHIMLVSFREDGSSDHIPWNHVISQLKAVFPFSNITLYRGDILLLIRKTNRGAFLDFDQSALQKLLERYDCDAAIGNYSAFLTSLPPMYYQTRSILRLGRTMDPDRRIFLYEDYGMYHLVEMAEIGVQSTLYSRNIVYLTHPGLISLLRYDQKNGTDYTEILYLYLRNERNAAETAKKLFIHRNTMLNRVRKIEEILGFCLDDPVQRERLLFSYHVLEYTRRYRKEDILQLRRNRGTAPHPTPT